MMTFIIILLIIDSIWALRVAYKEEWLLLAIAVAIAGLLNFLIMYLHQG